MGSSLVKFSLDYMIPSLYKISRKISFLFFIGCSYSNYTCEQSKEQKAGNFASIDDISLDACAQYCCQTVACTGYTYSNLTRTCKLSDQLSTSKLTVINAIGDSMYCTKNGEQEINKNLS